MRKSLLIPFCLFVYSLPVPVTAQVNLPDELFDSPRSGRDVAPGQIGQDTPTPLFGDTPTPTPFFGDTPTPTFSFDDTPTPPVGFSGMDLVIDRVYMVLYDGDNDVGNDVEITNPEPNQEVIFRADIRNVGTVDILRYSAVINVDDEYFNDGDSEAPLLPNFPYRWATEPWSAPEPGRHTVTWFFDLADDDNPENNTEFLEFVVGNPDDEPTLTPTPDRPAGTPTPSPTFAPGGEPVVFELEGATLPEAGWAEIPGGFVGGASGTAALGDLNGQIPGSLDNRGLRVTVEAGQIHFLYPLQPIATGRRPLLIRALVRADRADADITLVALKGSLVGQTVDNSMAFHSAAGASSFVDRARDLVLVYQPDTGNDINLAFQVAAHPNAGPVNVYVDKIEYQILNIGAPYDGRLFDDAPDLQADGGEGTQR